MALQWSDTLVFFSNNAVAGPDRGAFRTGTGGRQRQDLASRRHAGSRPHRMTWVIHQQLHILMVTKVLQCRRRSQRHFLAKKGFRLHLRCQWNHLVEHL